jgi:hypothetical protein
VSQKKCERARSDDANFCGEKREARQQNDEWAIQRSRYMTLESVAPVGDDSFVRLPAVAVRPVRPKPEIAVITPP